MSNKYNYDELRSAAIRPDASQEDINALGEWFQQYGNDFWNGEYYDADGYRLFPILAHDEENDVYTVSGYEFS